MRQTLLLLLGIVVAGCTATPIPLPLNEGGPPPYGKLDARGGDLAAGGPGDTPSLHADGGYEGRDDGRKDGIRDGGGDGLPLSDAATERGAGDAGPGPGDGLGAGDSLTKDGPGQRDGP